MRSGDTHQHVHNPTAPVSVTSIPSARARHPEQLLAEKGFVRAITALSRLRKSGNNFSMNITTIGIRELRYGLSRHLAAVREGNEITVTDHAKILPIQEESELERMVQEGIVTLPSATRKSLPKPVEANGTASDLVAEQRR